MVVSVEFHTESRSSPVVVLLSTRTTTAAALAPVQPLRIEPGAIASLKVNVTESFTSSLPAVAPPFGACTSVPSGVVLLSTIRAVIAADVAWFPPASVAIARRSYDSSDTPVEAHEQPHGELAAVQAVLQVEPDESLY